MESTYIPTNREMLNKSHYFHSMEFHTVLKELQRVLRITWECVCIYILHLEHGVCSWKTQVSVQVMQPCANLVTLLILMFFDS